MWYLVILHVVTHINTCGIVQFTFFVYSFFLSIYLVSYLFVCFICSEIIFENESGMIAFREDFESLAPGLWVSGTIIDVWAALLNHEERCDKSKSPTRLFFPTSIFVSSVKNIIVLFFVSFVVCFFFC